MITKSHDSEFNLKEKRENIIPEWLIKEKLSSVGRLDYPKIGRAHV